MKKKCFLVIALCMFFLTSCKVQQRDVNQQEMNNNFQTLENIILADTIIEFGEYKDSSISLVMTVGQYYTEDQTVPGGGTYPENYDGEFFLQFKDSEGIMVDEFSLNQDWDEQRINFPGEFTLCVTDYNEDGFPDFTIGTYGSSSMNIFRLYSIDEDRKIINIGVQDGFTDINKKFSVFFKRENGNTNFYTTVWNNATGEEEMLEWKWSVEKGKYILK